MRDQGSLFCEESLDDQLRARQGSVAKAVDNIPKDQLLISSDREVIEHLVASLSVEPLLLHEGTATMSQNETQVDVSGGPGRMFPEEHRGPFHVPGTRVRICIPFTGDEWVFRYRTNPWSESFSDTFYDDEWETVLSFGTPSPFLT